MIYTEDYRLIKIMLDASNITYIMHKDTNKLELSSGVTLEFDERGAIEKISPTKIV